APCRARASSLPPCIAASSLLRRSATSAFIASALARNSRESVSSVEVMSLIVWPTPASARLVEQLPADQHAPDLAGARADLIELGIAQIASRGIIVDVAVAAKELHGIERDLGGILGGVEDGAGGILARSLAAVTRFGDRVDIGLAGIHADIHVGDLALHQLELADRLAELLALVDIGHRHVHACLHDAERARCQHHALEIEPGHQDGDTAT